MVKNPPSMKETWVGKIPWRRQWQLTPVFLPGNPMDRGAWRAIVRGVTKSRATKQQTATAPFLETSFTPSFISLIRSPI